MRRPLLALVLTVGVISAAVAFRDAPQPPAAPQATSTTEAKPRFWKGNLHTHSLWSDGDDFPEMIADWYKRNGYQFLALTEHNVLAEGDKWVDAAANPTRKKAVEKYLARFGPGWVERREEKGKPFVRLKPLREFRALLDEPGRFHLVPGEEVTHKYLKRPVHLNAINLGNLIKPVDGGTVGETVSLNLRSAADQEKRTGRPMAAFLNHPNFQWGVTAEDMLAAEGLKFFEVFNGHSGVRNYGDVTHAGCERIWDILLAVRLGKLGQPVLYGLATDDSHAYHEFAVGKTNPGRGWVMVRAPYLSGENVVRGLHAGDFYASTGVVLDDVERSPAGLRLAIRTEPGVSYRTEFVATMRDAPLESTPLKGPDGAELPVTRAYSEKIGAVVAVSTEPAPAYRFTGKELYVRAKVTSSKPHPNPYQKGDTEVAWTQPAVP